LTLIRSGEDWSKTQGEERRTWFEDIEPVLQGGMNFLRDDGLEVGCYCNRYCLHADENGKLEERGFGVSFWRSLRDLESWAESHPSHLQIFVTFLRLSKKFHDLPLYHEVGVFDSGEQYFEYINCDAKTGVMRAVAS
jgi:aldoxime dehydratase